METKLSSGCALLIDDTIDVRQINHWSVRRCEYRTIRINYLLMRLLTLLNCPFCEIPVNVKGTIKCNYVFVTSLR